ncbi:hypothetical protein FEM48_Zijuj10G0103100 [Ziziphus jujuba var. spinosa]|uniref:Sulfotransferase n=1 Tax=Ziziphus jujuba var. spinosa TaxID=714518 RepID=A0A978UMT4_ZIZJJ|nr:cytosolic sulfotransferase 12-like [Ziziphus jujuba var. spinosa]KAH7516136.1 hypothetical protein FEM48_Zijuj10G0103100 [Ziziphus jujuba var. spinosa]
MSKTTDHYCPPDPPNYLKEDELTQECRDLLPSLPSEKGWVSTQFYLYQGFWYSVRHLPGVLSCQKHFQAKHNDIFLVSNPKSGTTWLKAIAFSLLNRVNYPNLERHPLLKNNPHVLVPFLDIGLYLENQLPDLTSLASPRLFSTHLPYVSLPESVKLSACKIVYLCRNPKDTFVSLWHFTNKLRPTGSGTNTLEESFDKFCRGVSIYGPFWDHLLGYWKESLERSEKVLFMKFEEMKEQPILQLRRLAEFIGCPFSPQEEENGVVEDILRLCSFETLSNLEVNKNGKLSSGMDNKAFFGRGEVGDWMDHLTAEMAQELDSIIRQKLNGSGLKF